ncbi:MAG: hypothetical protein IJ825_01505, partial [Oscillospiraceae bacterium]|nr:hypothetical protein [Oscillospiraceae bacterium]
MSKIIIHYIWFENYCNFNNTGLNLSSKYIFIYNPNDNTIIVKDKSKNFIDDFFGKNIALTAIVGQNGVGKTSLLRFIQSLRSGDLIQIPCLIICECDGAFWAGRYYFDSNQIKRENLRIPDLPNISMDIKQNEIQRFPFCESVRFIYLTEMFNTWQYVASLAGGDDISIASILYNQTEFGEEEKHINNPVVKYIHRINDWQLAFLSNGRQFVEQFNIKYPSHVFISPSYDRDAFVNLYIRIKNHDDTSEESTIDVSIFKEEARKYLCSFLHETDYDGLHSIKDEYAIAILMNIISSFHYVLSMSTDQGKQLFKIMNQKAIFQEYTCAWDVVYKLLLKIKQNNDYCDYLLNNRSFKDIDDIFQFSIDADAYIEFM